MNTLMRALCALIIGVLLIPAGASALTAEEIQVEINRLLGEVATLRARMVQLQQQQQASSTPQTIMPAGGLKHRLCAKLIRNLREGVEGDDVRALQEFLQLGGWLNTTPTGFFGPMTREALKRWQARSGIVSEGNADTTGWGLVGPRTRAFLGRWCSGLFTAPVATTTVATSSLSLSGVVSTSTTAGNQPPVISGVVGPTTLPVETEGTWTISASDPEGGALTYNIMWGEEDDAVLSELLLLADAFEFTSANIFDHTYDIPGLYKLAVRVRDTAGGIALGHVFVQVQSTAAFLDWFGGVVGGGNGSSGEGGNACTMDAYQCPNGQWVGRSGANCQFVCPNSGAGSGSIGSGASCLFNGQTFGHGQTRSESSSTCRGSGACSKLLACFNGQWGDALEPEGGSCHSGQTLLNGLCFWQEGFSPDGSCRFNNQKVTSGSWITAYEKQFVAGTQYNDVCKLEIRTCRNGVLSGTFNFPTCTSSTDW